MRFIWSATVLTLALTIRTTSAQFLYAGCDVSSAVLKLPPKQSVLKLPSEKPNSIGLGVGYQNYTCTAEGKYKPFVTMGELYDISCLHQAKGSGYAFDKIQEIVYAIWNNKDVVSSLDKLFNEPVPKNLVDMGLKGLSDVDIFFKDTWLLDIQLGSYAAAYDQDIYAFSYWGASRWHDEKALLVAHEDGSLPAPTGPQDLPWLKMKRQEYDLAKTVMMVDTIGGQPPKSCKPGSDPIAVKYAAKYWFFGGSPSPLVAKYGNKHSSSKSHG